MDFSSRYKKNNVPHYNMLTNIDVNKQIDMYITLIEFLANYDDTNKLTTDVENFIMAVISIANKQKIYNLNTLTEDFNFPAIDLLSSDGLKAFQVTTGNKNDKFASTINTTLDFKIYHSKEKNQQSGLYEEYQKYFENIKEVTLIYFNSKRKSYHAKPQVKEGVTFESYGIGTFISDIQNCDKLIRLKILRELESIVSKFIQKRTYILPETVQEFLNHPFTCYDKTLTKI